MADKNKGTFLSTSSKPGMPGSFLAPGEYLRSSNCRFVAAVSPEDGGLRVYRGSSDPIVNHNDLALWDFNSRYPGPGEYFLVIQEDGNLCVYRGTGPADNQGFVWGSLDGNARESDDYCVIMQDDGHLAVYETKDPSSIGSLEPIYKSWNVPPVPPAVISTGSDPLGELPRGIAMEALACIPAVGGFVALFADTFWSMIEGQESLWDQIKAQVEALVKEKIDAAEWNNATAWFATLNETFNDYSIAFSTFNESPKSDSDKRVMRDAFFAAKEALDSKEYLFQVPTFEVLLLPLFTAFASIQMGLIRDGILYKEAWGVDQHPFPHGFDPETALTGPTGLIAKYTEYVDHWYKIGLNNQPNPGQNDWISGHSLSDLIDSTSQWQQRNAYIRFMQLQVRDAWQSWSSLDPKVCPPGSPLPKLPREIYSDPIGTASELIQPGPAQEERLTGLLIWGEEMIAGVYTKYGPDETGRVGPFEFPYSATEYIGQMPYGTLISRENPIVTVSGTCTLPQSGGLLRWPPASLVFVFQDGRCSPICGNKTELYNLATFSYPGHILSSIKVAGMETNKEMDCIIFGFRRADSYPDS